MLDDCILFFEMFEFSFALRSFVHRASTLVLHSFLVIYVRAALSRRSMAWVHATTVQLARIKIFWASRAALCVRLVCFDLCPPLRGGCIFLSISVSLYSCFLFCSYRLLFWFVGSYTAKEGLDICLICETRMAVSFYGATVCYGCDARSVVNNRRSECLCDPGWSMFHLHSARVLVCGLWVSHFVSILSVVASWEWSLLLGFIILGYFAKKQNISETKPPAEMMCVPCPKGSQCDKPGATWETLAASPGPLTTFEWLARSVNGIVTSTRWNNEFNSTYCFLFYYKNCRIRMSSSWFLFAWLSLD